ncbi:MAG: type II toxin-antitoxin system Phd/YefM family antitoxin [Pseudomonadota bacterium]
MPDEPLTGRGPTHFVSTSVAREKIAEIILLAQDPRAAVVLTRHGKRVAAVVSVEELERIWKQQDVEDIVEHGRRPVTFYFGKWSMGARSNAEAAEMIQQMQMDRFMEREVLKTAGLKPVPGGELEETVEVRRPKRRWWPFRRR